MKDLSSWLEGSLPRVVGGCAVGPGSLSRLPGIPVGSALQGSCQCAHPPRHLFLWAPSAFSAGHAALLGPKGYMMRRQCGDVCAVYICVCMYVLYVLYVCMCCMYVCIYMLYVCAVCDVCTKALQCRCFTHICDEVLLHANEEKTEAGVLVTSCSPQIRRAMAQRCNMTSCKTYYTSKCLKQCSEISDIKAAKTTFWNVSSILL